MKKACNVNGCGGDGGANLGGGGYKKGWWPHKGGPTVLNPGPYLSLGPLGDRVGEAVVLPALAGVVRLRGGELLALPGAVRGVRRLRVV